MSRARAPYREKQPWRRPLLVELNDQNVDGATDRMGKRVVVENEGDVGQTVNLGFYAGHPS